MSKVRLHLQDSLISGGSVDLGSERAHYLGTVLRLGLGEDLAVFNGTDGEFDAAIENIGKKRCTVRLGRMTRRPVRDADLWLVFAPIKRVRIDFLAGKATELGASALWPTITARTNVARVSLQRLYANAVEAAEQCGRMSVPKIFDPCPLESMLASWPEDRSLYWCDETGGGGPAAQVFGDAVPAPAAVLVGPEGGFDDIERAHLRSFPAGTAIDLGPRVMRAETAAFAALSCWQAILGDWAADDRISGATIGLQ